MEVLSWTSPNVNSSIIEGQGEPLLICKEHPGPLMPFHARLRRAQARRAARWACVRQGRTAGRLERMFTSWSRLRIVLTLTLTMLTIYCCVRKALAVAVLSLIDVRVTNRSCCLGAAYGRPGLLGSARLSVLAKRFLRLLMTEWMTSSRLATSRTATPSWSHSIARPLSASISHLSEA